jgi:hypothetical protein
MSIKSIKTGWNGISALSGNDQWFGDFEAIAVTTLTTSAASIDFSSIPSTYTHLQLRIIARSDYADILTGGRLRFNSDTGSNYAWHRLYGDGASATASASTSQTQIRIDRMTGTSAGTNTFGVMVTDVLDYGNTNKYTTIRSLGGYDNNGNGWAVLASGLWMNTAAVTSISFANIDGGNLIANTQVALYGIRG